MGQRSSLLLFGTCDCASFLKWQSHLICSCYLILGLMKSWVQISITGSSRAQRGGESGIPQFKEHTQNSFALQMPGSGRTKAVLLWTCAQGAGAHQIWPGVPHHSLAPHKMVAWSLLLYWLCLTGHCCSWVAITQSIRWDGGVLGAPGSVSYLFAPLPCLSAPQEWVVSGVPVKLAVTDTYCWHPGIPCHLRTTGTCLKIVLFSCTFPSNPSFSWCCLIWSKPLPIAYSLSTLSLVGCDELPSLLFWACRSPRHNTVPAQWWQLNYNNFSASCAAQIQYLWHY